jgi:hypothetical protein
MSMKVDIKDNYPDELKRLIEDYNSGIELQDIMEVNLAVDGILQLVFHTDPNTRDFARNALTDIAKIQPGFLKKGVQILVHRYKGNDREKSEHASIILGLLSETPVKQLITDTDVLSSITVEHNERVAKDKFEEEQKKVFLEKTQAREISFIGVSGQFLRAAQFYNKLIIDEDSYAAKRVLKELIEKVVSLYGPEENLEDFEMGCLAFSIVCKPENREPFVQEVVDDLIIDFKESKKKLKEGYQEFIINTIDTIKDLVPQKYQMEYVSLANQRRKEKKQEHLEKIKSLQEATRKGVNIEVTWENEVKNVASSYNEGIKNNDEKEIAKFVDTFKSLLFSKNPYIFKNSVELYSQLLVRNFELVEALTYKLIKDYRKDEVTIILGENLEILDKKELLQKGILNYLEQKKAERYEKEIEEKEKKRKEFGRIESLKAEFSADWNKRLLDVIEKINAAFINEKRKDAEKMVLHTMKNFIYAEDREVANQAIQFLSNVAEKYPSIIKNMMGEIIELFNSDHERRFIAIDLLGLLVKNINVVLLFQDVEVPDEFESKLKEDLEKREQDIKQSQLMDKWDAIKLDITTIVIDLEHDKKLQRVCRGYNTGIKAKDKEEVIKNVQIIVDWFLIEKDEEKLDQIVSVLGKISKQNIELIAPAIDMFLKMVDSEDEDKKFRAIKGLGEVAEKRPGWAYMAIDSLINIIKSDDNNEARMKAFIELSRIGRANATMLMEHIEAIIGGLRDPDKQVRRLAAYSIGAMAEVIPLEAQEAIPALREALHDEYFLVRQFADKALKLIRAAMRK